MPTDATYLGDLIAARGALVAAMISGPAASGLASYAIDGEEYKVRYSDLADAITKLDNLILIEANRVPGRTSWYVRRGWPVGCR